jgi:hypothetical protein
MRTRTLTVCLLLSAFVPLVGAVLASTTTQEGGTVDRPNDAAVQASFVSLIRKAADSGMLDDPSVIETIVGLRFDKSVEDRRTLPPGCKKAKWGTPERLIVTSYSVHGANWYHASVAGVPNMAFPSFTINPAGVVGAPAISYQSFQGIDCTDSTKVRNLKETRLDFNNLSSHVCLTPSVLQTLLPEAKFQQATDGVSLISYQGALDDNAGTKVQFSYRFGAECAWRNN